MGTLRRYSREHIPENVLALLSLFRYAWCRSSGACCYVHTPFASFQFGEDARALERFAGLRSQRACAAVRPEQALTRKHYAEAGFMEPESTVVQRVSALVC